MQDPLVTFIQCILCRYNLYSNLKDIEFQRIDKSESAFPIVFLQMSKRIHTKLNIEDKNLSEEGAYQ